MTNNSYPQKRVLFLCTHNSARSQVAEGLLRFFGEHRFVVFSAGTVATQVRPEAIDVMKEIGIDITGHESKTLERFLDESFDLIITVCDDANKVCPFFPHGIRRLHWSIEDPSRFTGEYEERLEAFRRTREELHQRIEKEILSAEK